MVILGGLLSIKNFEIWCAIEVRIVLFVITILTGHKNCVGRKIILYFSFQALASRILIFSIFISQSMDLLDLICWRLIRKLGLVPSHHWFVAFTKPSEIFSNLLTLSFVLVLQKLLPIYMLASIGPRAVVCAVAIILRALGGLIYLSRQQSPAGVIIGSSLVVFSFLVHTILFKIHFLIITLFLSYSALSISVIRIFIKFSPIHNLGSPLWAKTPIEKISMLVIVLIVRGFPPSPLFFLKVKIVLVSCQYSLQTRNIVNFWGPLLVSVLRSIILLVTRAVRIFSYVNLVYSFVFANSGERPSYFQWERFQSGERENVIFFVVAPSTCIFTLFLSSILF